MNSKVSIIVPVYNVEPYVERCIKSLCGQEHKNLEIILVDDGSTDNSGNICDSWREKDKRISVIHKENGGQASARNAGIEIASGDYLCFVDSDDEVSPHYVSGLLNITLETGSDIAACQFQIFESAHCHFDAEEETIEVIDGREALRRMCTGTSVSYVIVCNKLYRRDLFSEIRYPEGKIYEDEATVCKVYDLANKVVVTNRKLYGYFRREGSTTKSNITLDRVRLQQSIFQERVEYFQKKHDVEMAVIFAFPYAMNALAKMFEVRNALKDSEYEKVLWGQYKRTFAQIHGSHYLSSKKKVALYLFRFVPRAYLVYKGISQIRNGGYRVSGS